MTGSEATERGTQRRESAATILFIGTSLRFGCEKLPGGAEPGFRFQRLDPTSSLLL